MSLDYKKLGLKVGLEIHQQLFGRKLFCNCPAEINDNPPDAVIERTLRAVAGEQGAVDVAAAQETKRQRTFFYQIHKSNACLVEIDEEPPHAMNQDALQVALITAKLLQADIVHEIQVMRKTVVDGSNTTGFQRTALLAMQGKLLVDKHIITVPTICLEEDSCKIVEKRDHASVYNLSRLGIPLVEIATGPDIHSPDEAKEVAEKIGMLLRSTGKVKRGLGTIRQDLNVSIIGGTRIEIKGCQDLHLIPLLIENEVKRQMNLISIKHDFIKKGKKLPSDISLINLTSLFDHTSAKLVASSLKNNAVVLGIKLDHCNGFLGRETLPEKRFGTEVSDYAKVAAGVKGIFHSDELPAYGITADEVAAIKKELHCKEDDAFILVVEQKEKAERALHAAYDRIQLITEGVLKEVRNANPDGTTSYMRPLPGAARMYPETDILPIVPDVKHLVLPELIEDKIIRYEQKLALSKDLAVAIAKHEHMPLFEMIIGKYKQVKYAFVAEILVSYEPEILRNYKEKNPNILLITDAVLEAIFAALADEKIVKEHVLQALLSVSLGKTFDAADYALADDKEIEKIIKKVVHEHPGAAFGLLMGRCMAALQGKADGKTVSELLKKYVK